MQVMLVGKDSICRIGVEHILRKCGVSLNVYEDTTEAIEALDMGAIEFAQIVWVSFTAEIEDIMGLVKLRHLAPNASVVAHFQHLPKEVERALVETDILVHVDVPNATENFLELVLSTVE